MWNSPQSTRKSGKRYQVEDLRALTYSLGFVVDFLHTMPVKDVVDEPILQRMTREELVFSVHELLRALLDDVPIPPGGHPGYQEAIIAELLEQTHDLVADELKDPEIGSRARRAAWTSFQRLCGQFDAAGNRIFPRLRDTEFDPESVRDHESDKLTDDIWQDILIGDAGIWGEFLWDTDWRLDSLMDLPISATRSVTEQTGIDLDVVHRLPHTPSAAEFALAENFIRRVIHEDEKFETW